MQIKSNLTYSVEWGGWVVGDFESKAISASNSDEVEVAVEIGRALTMVRFVGKSHLNDQTPNFGQILVRHLPQKLDI